MELVAVTMNYAFRHPGGTGSVEDAAEIVGRNHYVKILFRQPWIQAIQIDEPAVVPCQIGGRLQALVVGNDESRVDIVQHVLQAARRQCGIERHERRAGFQNRYDGRDCCTALLEQQRDWTPVACPLVDRVRESIAMAVQLSVSKVRTRGFDGDVVRESRHLVLESARYRAVCVRRAKCFEVWWWRDGG